MKMIPRNGGWGSIVTILNQNLQSLEDLLGSINSEVSKCQGFYTSTSELTENVPSPQVGYWAIIGETLPGNLWVYNTIGTWENLGTSPINPDISDYPESEVVSNVKDIV